MKNLPQGWKIEKLGDLGKVLTGKTPSKAISEFWDSQDIPFYKPDDFSKNDITDLYDGKDYISNTAFVKAVKAPPNTVLTTCIGIIGKVAITKKECSFNQQINAVIPDERINYKFLAYSIIRLKGVLQQQANAAVVPMINKSEFSKTPITFPPLPQQEKIVSVLDTASALVEKQKALIEKYDLFLKSKFIEMFGDPVKNPMGWEQNILKELGRIQTGNTPPSSESDIYDGDVPFITPADLEETWLRTSRTLTQKGASFSRTVNEKATLVCCIGTIGKMGKTTMTSSFNQQINSIEWNNSINPNFGFEMMKFFKTTIKSGASSTTVPILKKSLFEKISVICPSIQLQNQFAQIVEHVERLKQKEQQKLEKLQILYDALMKRAFDGEIQ